MRYLLFLFLLVCSCSYAQTALDKMALDNVRSLIEKEKYDKAKNELDRLLPLVNYAPDNDIVNYYFLLGVCHYQKGDYQSAIKAIESSLLFFYKRKELDCEAHLKIAYYLADSYLKLGKAQESERIITIALVRCAKSWENSTYTAKMYSILEEVYNKNNVSAAILSQIKNEQNDLPDSILGNLDLSLNQEEPTIEDAEPSIQGMTLKKYIDKIDSISYDYTINDHIDLSIETLDEAEKELKKSSLQYHSHTRHLYLNKGNLYFRIRDMKDAKRQFLIAKELFERVNDLSSLGYAKCLNSLALVYQEEGKYFYSTNLLYAALGQVKDKLSTNEDHYRAYLAVCDDLAKNFYLMGEKGQATNMWKDNISQAEKQGIWDIAYSSACNYSYAQLEMGNYKEGIDVLRRFMNNDFEYNLKDAGFQNLLPLLYFYGDENTFNTLNDYTNFTKSNLTTILTSFSETERDAIWSERSRGLEMMTNAICQKFSSPELRELSYNTALFTKNISTKLPRYLADFVKNSTSSEIQSIYNDYLYNKKRIINRETSNDSLEIVHNQISLLERKLFSYMNDYRDLYDDTKINYHEIRKRLGSKDVAIEFVIIAEIISFDSVSYDYGAIINRSKYDSPQFVKLCNKDSLDLLFDYDGILADQEFANNLYDINNSKLYKLLIEPIIPYIDSNDKIYFSPVGMIHKINLMAVPYDGKRLMDDYTFVRVSSTSILLDDHDNEVYNSALVMGGIDYNESIQDMVSNANNNHTSVNLVAERSFTRGTWDEIPGTLQEATDIDSLFLAHSVSSTFLSHGMANEESIKALSGSSPDILHIATHGFFYSDASKSTSPLFSNIRSEIAKNLPMHYCGLLFAGANNAWIGQDVPNQIDDGILSGYEISLLDLSKTKLSVLSACKTGVGDVDDIDGVFGLQRGLKLAGVESIIMSLWNIPDKETRILMGFFYSNLMNGMEKHPAFVNAINSMRELYPSPYYWASFILLDGLN